MHDALSLIPFCAGICSMTRRWRPWLAATPFVLSVVASLPAKALTPYVYVPPEQELLGAGLGIAQTARQLLRLGQAEEAARLAALSARLLPDDPRVWALLAEAQLRSDRMADARESLARAKRLDPDKAAIWFAEAALALRSGQPDEAVTLLEEGLSRDDANAGAYFDLGNARVMQERPREALQAFERAAGLREGFWEAINNQGLVLFEMGRRDQAIQRWRRALAIQRNPEPMLALAAALRQQASAGSDEAMDLARRALREDPNYVLDSHQKEQLWGPRLREAARVLLEEPALQDVVEQAMANADGPATGSPAVRP
jgi:Tfp pilus assembly protein PilF